MNLKDKFGVKYKFPTRSCKNCKKYPCFQGIKLCKCDFAKYGCLYYKGNERNNQTNAS